MNRPERNRDEEIEPVGTPDLIQVSVVIPTMGRPQLLRECLAALNRQNFDAHSFEIIVVEDGPRDFAVAELIRDFAATAEPEVSYRSQPHRGPGAARNLGIRFAKGAIVAFTDDDCVPDPDWLKMIVCALLDDSKCAGVGGKTVRLTEGFIPRFVDAQHALRPPKNAAGNIDYAVTANAAYRRTTLLEVGGFKTDITWAGGEDTLLSFAMTQRGYYLKLETDALVLHRHPTTVRGVVKMYYRYGKGEYKRWQYGMIKPARFSAKSLSRFLRGAMGQMRGKVELGWRRYPYSLLAGMTMAALRFGYFRMMRRNESESQIPLVGDLCPPEPTACIILAGGGAEEHKWRGTGITDKSLLSVGSRSLVTRVVDAACAAQIFSTIVVVGRAEVLASVGADIVKVPAVGSIYENLAAGFERFEAERAVVMAADIPFLEARHLRDFVDSIPHGTEVAYPLIRREALQQWIWIRRYRYFPLREGLYTGASFGLLSRRVARDSAQQIAGLLDDRRDQLRLAGRIKPLLPAQAILGQLLPSARPAEGTIEEFLSFAVGERVRFTHLEDPFSVFDVDFYDEYRYAAYLDALLPSEEVEAVVASRPALQLYVRVSGRPTNSAAVERTVESLNQHCPNDISLDIAVLSSIGLLRELAECEPVKNIYTVWMEAGVTVSSDWFERFRSSAAGHDVTVGPVLCETTVLGRYLELQSFRGYLAVDGVPFFPYFACLWIRHCASTQDVAGRLVSANDASHVKFLKIAERERLTIRLARGAVARINTPGFTDLIARDVMRKSFEPDVRPVAELLSFESLIWQFRTFKPYASVFANLLYMICQIHAERRSNWVRENSG